MYRVVGISALLHLLVDGLCVCCLYLMASTQDASQSVSDSIILSHVATGGHLPDIQYLSLPDPAFDGTVGRQGGAEALAVADIRLAVDAGSLDHIGCDEDRHISHRHHISSHPVRNGQLVLPRLGRQTGGHQDG